MNGYQQKNQHLWWRAGFGPPADKVPELPKIETGSMYFMIILKASEKKPDFFDVADQRVNALVSHFQLPDHAKLRALKPEEKQMIRKQSVQDIAIN